MFTNNRPWDHEDVSCISGMCSTHDIVIESLFEDIHDFTTIFIIINETFVEIVLFFLRYILIFYRFSLIVCSVFMMMYHSWIYVSYFQCFDIDTDTGIDFLISRFIIPWWWEFHICSFLESIWMFILISRLVVTRIILIDHQVWHTTCWDRVIPIHMNVFPHVNSDYIHM